jgi:hypothetical protein
LRALRSTPHLGVPKKQHAVAIDYAWDKGRASNLNESILF